MNKIRVILVGPLLFLMSDIIAEDILPSQVDGPAYVVTEMPLQQSAPFTEIAVLNATLSLTEDEKQYYDASTERYCVANGHVCEIMIGRRLCCSGKPCSIYPSPILQLLTAGSWGICH